MISGLVDSSGDTLGSRGQGSSQAASLEPVRSLFKITEPTPPLRPPIDDQILRGADRGGQLAIFSRPAGGVCFFWPPGAGTPEGSLKQTCCGFLHLPRTRIHFVSDGSVYFCMMVVGSSIYVCVYFSCRDGIGMCGKVCVLHVLHFRRATTLRRTSNGRLLKWLCNL